MRTSSIGILRVVGARLLIAVFLTVSLAAAAQQASELPASVPTASVALPLDQVVKNLEDRNAQRTAALERFEGKRVYRMEYRGFPSNHDAEMVVRMNFQAPNSKEFSVVSQTGSKFIIDHVFKKLLEGELEAAKGDNRRQTALTRENYDFELASFESTPEGGHYVLNLLPKTSNKFLYRGKVWVDAKDFAVTRIEGEPGKSPSFWIKKTAIAHRYVKVDNFWLPAENHTESVIRLGGTATLSIEYEAYQILKAAPLEAALKPGHAAPTARVTSDLRSPEPPVWHAASNLP